MTPYLGRLTGKARGRVGWFGRVVMQIEVCRIRREYRYPNPPLPPGHTLRAEELETHWVDATPDLLMSHNVLALPSVAAEQSRNSLSGGDPFVPMPPPLIGR